MKKYSKSDVVAILAVIGIVGVIITMIAWGFHSDANGIRVSTREAGYRTEVPEGIEYPIIVRGHIEYDYDYIISRDTIVEFCDIKRAKKEMKRELKALWKEMNHRCENY